MRPGRRQRWSQVAVGPARSLASLVDSAALAVTQVLGPSASGSRGAHAAR